MFYPDMDEDGYGDPAGPTVGPACEVPGLWVANDGDCNDGDSAVSPDADEVCDAIDNDCNGAIDEGLTTTYYVDADGDGHGDPEMPSAQCADPGTGYAMRRRSTTDAARPMPPRVWAMTSTLTAGLALFRGRKDGIPLILPL